MRVDFFSLRFSAPIQTQRIGDVGVELRPASLNARVEHDQGVFSLEAATDETPVILTVLLYDMPTFGDAAVQQALEALALTLRDQPHQIHERLQFTSSDSGYPLHDVGWTRYTYYVTHHGAPLVAKEVTLEQLAALDAIARSMLSWLINQDTKLHNLSQG